MYGDIIYKIDGNEKQYNSEDLEEQNSDYNVELQKRIVAIYMIHTFKNFSQSCVSTRQYQKKNGMFLTELTNSLTNDNYFEHMAIKCTRSVKLAIELSMLLVKLDDYETITQADWCHKMEVKYEMNKYNEDKMKYHKMIIEQAFDKRLL